jgi:hypothetical protein
MPHFCYARTSEGQAAAYDQTSAMPRKLRSLLKVIDGKTSNEVFFNSLKAFGDVQGLLSSLHRAGLIELTKVDAPVDAVEADSSLMSKAKYSPVVSASEEFAPTQTAHSEVFSHQHTQPNTRSATTSGSAQDLQNRQQDLQLLVQDMSSFVLAYAPEQAFTVLSELEQTSSMEQMAVLLGGYELIIRHVGEPAKIHLKHIGAVLGKWL